MKLLITVFIIGMMLLLWCAVDIALADPLINEKAHIMVESSGNPLAVSFLGAKYGRGLYQLSEIAIKDYNQYHRNEPYLPQDAFNPVKARKIYLWMVEKRIPQLLRHYGHEVSKDNILNVYNVGIGEHNKGKLNVDYLAKYERFKRDFREGVTYATQA